MLNVDFGRLRGDLWDMPRGFCITHLLESPWDEDSWELRGLQDLIILLSEELFIFK